MIKLQGKRNSANVFTDKIDKPTKTQISELLREEAYADTLLEYLFTKVFDYSIVEYRKGKEPIEYYQSSSNDTLEYNITEMRFTKSLLAINIVDVGWRTVEPSQYDTFTVCEDKDYRYIKSH